MSADRRRRAKWALDTTGMAKSGRAPRKAELAEWVVELADEVERLRERLRQIDLLLPRTSSGDFDSYDGTANPVIGSIVADALAAEEER